MQSFWNTLSLFLSVRLLTRSFKSFILHECIHFTKSSLMLVLEGNSVGPVWFLCTVCYCTFFHHVSAFISSLAEKICFFSCCISWRSFPALINFYCPVQSTLCSAKQQANRIGATFLVGWTTNSSKGKTVIPCNFFSTLSLTQSGTWVVIFKSLSTSARGFLWSVGSHI